MGDPHVRVAGRVTLSRGTICLDSFVKKHTLITGRPGDVPLIQIWFGIPKLVPSNVIYTRIRDCFQDLSRLLGMSTRFVNLDEKLTLDVITMRIWD